MAVRRFAFIASLVLPALLSAAVQAQTDPIAWHSNLDAAKSEAKQTGKMVLVHFWTEDCAPCVALERNVFSQPEVANAIQAQFVPVKLNANANPATASQMGVTRVPTDIVLTPDGQMAGRLISPATPMAYVGELTQVIARFKGQTGHPMSDTLAMAPQPSQIPGAAGAPTGSQVNSVYAGLGAQNTVLPTQPSELGVPSRYGQTAAGQVAPQAGLATGDRYATNPPFGVPALSPAINQSVAQMNAATSPQSPVSAHSQLLQQPQASAPTMVDNRFRQGESAVPYSGQSVAGQSVTNQFVSMQTPTTPAAPAANIPVAQQQPAMNLVEMGQAVAAAGVSTKAATPTTAATSTAPDPRQLPAGAPPLGFDGYCPVSMRSEWKWVAGNSQFGAIHRGRTYWFAGPTQQQQFLANPDYYSPALSGIDPVLAIEHRQQVPGKREHSIDYDNLFYMFSSEASLQQFSANPERYAASVRAAMGIQRGRAVR